jgi:hypothetical protein
MQVSNAVFPPMEQAMERFSDRRDDGAFVMVNLLKFKPKAEYEDGSDADLTGAAGLCALWRGGAGLPRGRRRAPGLCRAGVTGLLLGEVEELWDMVALAEYPSLAAMQQMVQSPEYQAIEKHRKAGLAGQLNIRTKPVGR